MPSGEGGNHSIHYDGYPSHMLPALAPWTPEDILAAREIRAVRAGEIEAFVPTRDPVILPRPTRQFCHLYLWMGGRWVEVIPEDE
ncbi:hypothetical protein [Roseinatronobacter ekhonensis]|uniref:hypothetical protein n=1 Tax=Roseinatronobacter ekhonensis TaxID=254356 RepID=UPI000EAFF6D6|nr:hypothetical protein [Roseibaca ekhonensis]